MAPPPPPRAQSEIELETALHQVIETYSEDVVAFLIFDVKINHIQFDATSQWAVVWLDLYDPETGELIPTEPGLVVAQYDGEQWNLILQADPTWLTALTALPPDLMPEDNKAFWLARYDQVQTETPSAALGGYLLPWAEGLTKFLTRSISHGGTGYYAFDFADGTMFPLYASKGGTVHLARWDLPNGFYDGTCGTSNYIILKDETTTPVTYQLYLHLAHESIPENLRTVGAPVVQGQFIGNADDTGCSSGHHLHFHVHTNPYSYWGTALDITFDDVDINGGRPRTPSEASSAGCLPAPCVGKSTYTSQNTITDDVTAPTGGLLDPALGTLVTAPTLTLNGWAFDEGSGVDSAYFMANYNDAWVQVGPVIPATAPPFLPSYTWNWCSNNVPNGPVSLALHVEDEEGNAKSYLDIRHVLKQYTCTPPPPACTPAANQVALFTEANYGGDCITLDPGDHLLSPLATGLRAAPLTDGLQTPAGDVTVSSIKLGSSARVTLHQDVLAGRSQTFYADDPNLSDNWIGTQEISSAQVALKTDAPQLPPAPVWPTSNLAIPGGTSVSLVWDDGGGAKEFQVAYTGPGGSVTSTWQTAPVWHLGSLDEGNYSWKVKSRNANNVESGWSVSASFSVGATPSVPPAIPSLPYTEDFEGVSTWTGTGLWALLNEVDTAHSGTKSWWYGTPPYSTGTYETGAPSAGSLTSPPVTVPTTGYYLRFWSLHDTENGTSGGNQHWDQRWVQISADSGPFENVYQLTDDPLTTWVQSPFIDLSAYAGKSIRLRFHFETLDARDNAHKGWLIDDVTINDTAPPSCTDADNSPAQATTIAYGGTASGQICPAGDVDYFKFTGTAGDRIVVNVDAQTTGSNLDPYLFLLANDGASVVAENDDEVPFDKIDPYLPFTLPWSGTYYLKLRAWNHPGAGDAAHTYSLSLSKDSTAPAISNLSPAGSVSTLAFVQGDTVIPVTASVTDAGSGMEKVEFWWHSGDWVSEAWTLLGTDTDGSDGWALPGGWDTTPLPDQSGMGLYVRAVDRAGNVAVKGAWNLTLDSVPPQTTVVDLPSIQDSTAMLLQWSSMDNIAPIREYDIQMKVGTGLYEDFEQNLEPAITQLWVIGEFGKSYDFRVRAVDEVGNEETFNGLTNQTGTFIELCDEPDPWDENGNDDTFTSASVYSETQTHTFCDAGDEDWVLLTLEGGNLHFISTAPLDPSSAVVIEVYAEDGITQLDQVFPQDPNGNPTSGTNSIGLPTLLIFTPPTSGTYYLRLYHPVSGVAGSAVRYELNVNSYQVYLPVIAR